MTETKIKKQSHLTEIELADFLENSLDPHERQSCEEHLSSCAECLTKAVSAYEVVWAFKKDRYKNRKVNMMKKINPYLMLAVMTFALSFFAPRYFLQLLLATLLLGAKWIVDSKSTKMLVMIHEAWKSGGEKEASRIIRALEPGRKNRL
jgi:hypothetical protein